MRWRSSRSDFCLVDCEICVFALKRSHVTYLVFDLLHSMKGALTLGQNEEGNHEYIYFKYTVFLRCRMFKIETYHTADQKR